MYFSLKQSDFKNLSYRILFLLSIRSTHLFLLQNVKKVKEILKTKREFHVLDIAENKKKYF